MASKAEIDILINAKGSAQTLGDLEERQEKLLDALKRTKLGSQEYKALNQELTQTGKQVKNLELGFEALDNEQVASEIGSVAGAVGDVTAAMILLGGEDENLEKIAANIEQALGVSMAFKGAIEGASSAMKLFNNVVRANPIGIIVTAVALLIAGIVALVMNFDKVKDLFIDLHKTVGDFMADLGVWGDVIRITLLPLTFMLELILWLFSEQIDAIHELNAIEQAAFDKRVQQQTKIADAHKARLAQIEAERKAEENAFGDRQERFDLDIARLEAEGKNSDTLRKKKIEDVLAFEKFQLESIQQQLQSWTDYYEDLFVLSGKSREDFIAQMKGQGIDLKALLDESAELVEDQQNRIFAAETDRIAFETEIRAKASEAAKVDAQERIDFELQLAEDRKAFLEQEAETARLIEEGRINALRQLRELEVSQLEDEFEQKAERLLMQHEAEMEAITGQTLEEDQLRLALEAQYLEELAIIRQEGREAEAAKEEEDRAKRIAANKELAENTINNAQGILNNLEQINNLASKNEINRIKAKQARGEALTAGEEKRLRRQAAINKAFAVAQIAIDTATALSGAISQAQSVPFPANIAAIAAGVTAVLSGIAGAAAALGQSPNIPSAGSITGGGSGGGGGSDVTDLTGEPNLNPVETGSTTFNGPQKVFVVESDITDTQAAVAEIKEASLF